MIKGPREVYAHLGVQTEEDYRRAQLQCSHLERKEDARVIVASVNDERWVADCPLCHAGMSLEPGWKPRCFNCGAVFAGVEFPELT